MKIVNVIWCLRAIFSLAVLSFWRTTFADNYDSGVISLLSPCDTDFDCASINGTCVKVAETCYRGVCTCVEPFVTTPSGHCRRGVTPWRSCNVQIGDICVGKNFQCIDGQCQCRPGLFPVGETCVQMAHMVTSLGSTCSDDSNCLPGMECRQWVSANGNGKADQVAVTICQCPPTHRVLNNTQCVPRQLGDSCSGSDTDCGLVLDAVCSPETLTCVCPPSHLATKTLINLATSVVEGYATAWRLVDACRPLNGATKIVGQRCTNSLQCQFGHMCARCEPKNLNTPKTCNKPACSSPICRNLATCPLCPKEESTSTSTTSTTESSSTTTATTEITSDAPFGESAAFETPAVNDIGYSTEQRLDEATLATSAPVVKEAVDDTSGVNVALAVTLPLLALSLIGMAVFVRYAWGKLNWRRAVKCVEALETASSSASSGSSSINHHFAGDATTISEVPITTTPFGMQNVAYYGSECAFTQASATLLVRSANEPTEVEDDDGEEQNQCSALTVNYNSSNFADYRKHQDGLFPSAYSHHVNHMKSNNNNCPRHKYCFNSYTMEDMIDTRIAEPPKLPLRSKSIRSLAYYPENNQLSTVGASLMTSRLEIDRRKPLQY